MVRAWLQINNGSINCGQVFIFKFKLVIINRQCNCSNHSSIVAFLQYRVMAADRGDLQVTFSYSMPQARLFDMSTDAHPCSHSAIPASQRPDAVQSGQCMYQPCSVYYVFKHAMCLDFTSVLCGNDRDMGLDAVYFLHMLECHPHATTLRNFKLPVGFDQFEDLSTYLEQTGGRMSIEE